jgi:site-specific recombinase XerD
MTTAAPSTALATIQPVLTDAERLALAGFLAGYRGLTREAYALDLRQFTTWCRSHSVDLLAVRRADIESFARELEAKGRARATVTRRLCTIAGFYKYAVEEELLDHSPAAHVRRPRVDYESRAVALDRNELGALLVAAGLGSPAEHALMSLLALNGLRVSEAIGADIDHLGLERGHRTLTIIRKGGKMVTIPLAPRTARAIDLAIGDRTHGPVFVAADGRRLDRHGAGRIVRKTARRAGIGKAVTPHTLRHAFITAAQVPGSRSAMSKKPLHMLTHVPRCGMTGRVAAWIGTRLISSRPTSRAPPGNPRGLAWGLFRLAAAAARREVNTVIGHGQQHRSEREPPICAAPGISASIHLGAQNVAFGARTAAAVAWHRPGRGEQPGRPSQWRAEDVLYGFCPWQE